jgi:hypothetical protein
MSDRFDDISEAMMDETLTEMAQTFFGGRKEAEVFLERFQEMVERLEDVQKEVVRRGATLHGCLLDRETAREFWKSIGVAPEPLLEAFGVDEEDVGTLDVDVPMALTVKGRLTKLLQRLYAELQEDVDAYLHGHYVADEERKGRKRLTVNLDTLQDLAWRINNKIDKLNSNLNPSAMLHYLRNLDPEGQEKRNITGGVSYENETDLDEAMRFEPIDMESLGLTTFPELPEPAKVEGRIKDFAASLVGERKDEVSRMLDRVGGKES